MRTAEQILWLTPTIIKHGSKWHSHVALVEVINQVRKETIEECSKVPALKFGDKRAVAIKQSILSLINELK